MDLVENEKLELEVIEKYLPSQMTEDEIKNEVRSLISEMGEVTTNPQVLIGKTMGAFNKKFQGRADIKQVKQIIEEMVV
jgi:uncharacterized protein YqeY